MHSELISDEVRDVGRQGEVAAKPRDRDLQTTRWREKHEVGVTPAELIVDVQRRQSST
jgi:hypothetical protein